MSKQKLSLNKQLQTIIIAVFLSAFLFGAFFRGSFHSIDVGISVWIPSIQSGVITVISKGFAIVFDTQSLALLSLGVTAYLFIKNRRAEGLLLLGAMGGEALLVGCIKDLVQSPRPLNGLVVDTGFSFPSGHTAGSIVFCGALAFLAWHHWERTRAHVSIGIGVAAVSSVVGFSRIYLNVHWFSDVLGGGMLGVFWLFFVILVFQLLHYRVDFESERFRLISLLFFILAIVVIAFIVGFGLID